jgi:hypothetical protein
MWNVITMFLNWVSLDMWHVCDLLLRLNMPRKSVPDVRLYWRVPIPVELLFLNELSGHNLNLNSKFWIAIIIIITGEQVCYDWSRGAENHNPATAKTSIYLHSPQVVSPWSYSWNLCVVMLWHSNCLILNRKPRWKESQESQLDGSDLILANKSQ